MIIKCTQIFVDSNYKISPSGFYQVLNIGGYLSQINGIFPLIFKPTTGKSQYLYEQISYDIKKILIDNKIDYKKITDQY